jgi:hypothetical protein
MSTTSATAESAAVYARRGRRQKAAVLAGATLLGVWLGTSAPTVSPVATPVVPAVQKATVPGPAIADPGPPDRRGPFGVARAK